MNPQYLHQQVGDQSQGFGPSKPGMLPPGPQGSFGMNSGLPPPQSGFMQPPTTMAYNGPMGSLLAQNNMKPVPLNPMQSGPPQMGPPPNQMQPGPPHLGPPPNQMQPGPPQMTGPPPNQMQPGPPQMGPPPNQMQPGPPQMTGPPPNQMQPGPPQMTGPPSNQMQPGPPSHMGPPTNQMPGPPQPRQQQQPGPPSNQPGPPGTQPSQLGPPMGQGSPAGPFGSPMAGKLGPTNQFGSQSGQPGPMGPPPMNQGSPMNQPGPPGSQMKNGPSLGQMGMPPPPNLQICPPKPQPNQQMPFGVNPPPFQPNPMAPPTLGPGSPMNQSNQLPQPGPPPLPGGPPRGNMAPGQYSNKGAPTAYQNMAPPPVGPPGPMNYPPGPNQLANQMSDMHIGGAGPPGYGGPMKPQLNGENSPHMPPPLGQNQGQYMNGAQNRGPQQPMGYPPMPGQQPQQQQMPGGPYPTQQNYQQNQQQARRLDPDQMPSPIQVTLDDQRTRSGVFSTNQKGLAPPLVSTNFITQDQGNAGPRYIRSTMYSVPTTSDMMKQTAVPFGIVISPLARIQEQEYPPPIVDFGALGPVRCIRCKAYMSPFMQFIDSGKRFQCSFCKATTEVPAEYFQHLDHTGQRVDRYDRPELILGTYEFVATQEYCRNNTFPKAPAIIFVIDVSYNNIKSGLVHLLCAEMKEILNHLPVDQGQEKTKMKVGFITYNSTVHFYNIKGNLAQPQMMVVGDVQEIFMPLLDGFLCDVEDSAAVIDSLMVQIPAMFGETRETETVLLPAIQAGLEALKASECAGKLIVFHSTLPTADAPGRLKNRDERKLLGTEKERTVLVPQTQAYNTLGQDCVAAGCSVDLFITNNSYIDIATIGQICRLTGGEIFKYTYFQANIDGPRLVNDVITDISRPVAFDSIMRVRTSTGVRPTEFFGHFYMSNTTDMEIPAIDCDKAIAIEIKHDDKLTEEEGVYIQVALLYTSCSGQRRLRILNLSLKTCSQMSDLYRSCELDTIVNFFAKQSVYRLLENNPKSVKDSLVNRCAQMLACYRKNCASPSSAGQLILPECMKLLPLYVNCLMKSDAISGGSDMTLDDRSFVMQCVTTMDIPTSVAYFYPRLIPLHEIQNGTETPEIPSSIRCTVEKMADNGVYLLENGIHMLLWIGLNANSSWIQSVFGVSNAAQIDVDQLGLPELDNCLSQAVRNLIDQVRIQRHRCMRLTLVRQRDKLETVFRHFLVEDRGNDGSSSYVDFLCHMHKEIRQLLS